MFTAIKFEYFRGENEILANNRAKVNTLLPICIAYNKKYRVIQDL